jgi:biopolymer transport protein ExbD
MAISAAPAEGDDEVIAAINTTPLVDVMLVLLIIFLITIPVVTTSVPVELPKETVEVRETKPENLVISVDSATPSTSRTRRWQHAGAGGASEEGFGAASAARGADPRRLTAQYEGVGKILYACQRPASPRWPSSPNRRPAAAERSEIMAMNVGSSSGSGDPEVMMDINTTPLIDVMLVLLIMLIITIPIQLHAVNLNLPVGTPPPSDVKPEVVKIDVDAKSVVHWQGVPVASGAELEQKMKEVSALADQPEVHLRAPTGMPATKWWRASWRRPSGSV